MKNCFNIILVATTLLALISCENFLKEVPESVNTSESYFKTESDAWSALNGVYSQLRIMGVAASNSSQSTWMYSMTETQDNMHYQSSISDVMAINNFSIVPTNIMVQTSWAILYGGVARANNVLDNIDKVPVIKQEVKTQIIAEARFLRGFYYFYLVRLFGDVPLTLNQIKSVEMLPRESVDNVYKAIIADFEFAYQNLAIVPKDMGRATKGAAAGFLSKVYLTRKDWSLSAQYAQNVVQLGVYSLLTNNKDYYDVNKKATNTEAMFECQSAPVSGLEGTLYRYLNNKDIPENPSISGVSLKGPSAVFSATWDLFFNYDKNDKRRDLTIAISWDRKQPPSPKDSSAYPWPYKYVVMVTADGLYANNWPYLKYGDVLLMYAEALNEQNKTAEAYQWINIVRRRAFGYPVNAASPYDLSGLSQVQFREAVYKERRLELSFEGHRWFDLVRTGRLETTMNAFAQRLQREYSNSELSVRSKSDPNKKLFLRNSKNLIINPVSEKHNLYPIPQIERDVNPLLEQNSGY